jgi:hypothetical protein
MENDFGMLVDFLRGELDSGSAAKVRARLEDDSDYFDLFQRLKRTYAVLRSLPTVRPGAADVAEIDSQDFISVVRREFEARDWLTLLPWIDGREEFLRTLDWLWLILISALTIDAGLYWVSADVVWYVGLSGVLHGIWAGAGVSAWHIDPRQAAVLTALIVAKLAYETLVGAVPLTGTVAAGPVIAVAHAYGAMGGASFGLAALAIRSRERSL